MRLSFERIAAIILALLMVLLLFALTGCSDGSVKMIDSELAEQFRGKKVGVLSGSVGGEMAEKYIPECELFYFNSYPDMAVALDLGKIDAYISDEPNERAVSDIYPDHSTVAMLEKNEYGFAFPKDSEKSEALCKQLNEFLAEIKANGTLKELDNIWFGSNEDLKVVDYDSLTGENGTLIFSVSSDIGIPFTYVKDQKYVGYDVDIAVRFCKEYGYGIEIADASFPGFLSSIVTGKSDFGASCLSITEERKKSVLFSEADYVGGSVLVVKAKQFVKPYESLEDLNGKTIGSLSGSVIDKYVSDSIQKSRIEYINSSTDLAVALESGKINAYAISEPLARILMSQYKNHYVVGSVAEESYGFLFSKDSEKSKKLCGEMNAFLAELREDGTLEEIENIWLGGDEGKKILDYDGLTGENGTINLVVSSDVGEPFVYLKDGKYVGYEMDIISRFCREHGYDMEISDTNLAGFLAGIAGGKYDMGASCVTITPEREKTMLFSDPNFVGGCLVVAKGEIITNEEESFITPIIDGFEKTFVNENRWKLFASGLLITLTITVLSTIFGTVIGFFVFVVYRKNRKVFNGFIDVLSDILEKTPIVVILMIMYYVVFGKSNLSGVWVSVIGFTMLFATSVIALLKVAVGAVPVGQMEGALALGYTDDHAFLRIILPQALRYFLPGYKNAIVTLIKNTAIVGYIAVQDLTKVGDIIRSRTYEAFFPLIATAVIYFIVAWLLTIFVSKLEIEIDPKRRKKEKILKGVVTK